MGDSKRRKEKLGDRYGKSERIVPFLGITKEQSAQFQKWTTRGAWIGIGCTIAFWVTVRFIGPALDLWTVQY